MRSHNTRTIYWVRHYSLTAPFNLRTDGSRATDDAAAAAATRILHKEGKPSIYFSAFILNIATKHSKIQSYCTFYVHRYIHLFHPQSPPA